MSEIKQVTVSGSVGKQVFSSSQPVILNGVIVDAVSAATLTIRDGESSGDVKLTASVPGGNSRNFQVGKVRFDKGMHVKITGTNSKCYLVIE